MFDEFKTQNAKYYFIILLDDIHLNTFSCDKNASF